MKIKKNINKRVEAIISSAEAIEDVKVSPFLKDKTMRLLFENHAKDKSMIWSWFTPQLQLATLVCIVALNIFAFLQLQNANSSSELSDFAESYGLNIESSESLIN